MQSQKTVDYRNAKYQGAVLNGQRNGLGILVDDDLAFYTSEWESNQLAGNSVIYLGHGKYIYGQWKNNQPHGLNVFRIGDTVLVGVLENGEITHRVLVIFEMFNFIAVLEKQPSRDKRNGDKANFRVLSCGQLHQHEDLLKFMKLLEVKVPDQYFSLIKFICSIVDGDIKAKPSKSGNCYFGYDQGLAIVFNSNNGVVSVGSHSNGKIAQFGGKFTSKDSAEQGNFETKETILYTKTRPKSQISVIYQKIHKRSLDFQNSFFYSKLKTLANVQDLLRGKISEIMETARKGKFGFTAADLNDSLDYQVHNQDEFDQLTLNRQQVYETPKNAGLKKKISYFEGSTKKVSNKSDVHSRTPRKRTPTAKDVKKLISKEKAPQEDRCKSPIYVKQFQPKRSQANANPITKDRSLSKSKSATRIRQPEMKKLNQSSKLKEKDEEIYERENTRIRKVDANKRQVCNPYIEILQKDESIPQPVQFHKSSSPQFPNLQGKMKKQQSLNQRPPVYQNSPDRAIKINSESRNPQMGSQSPYRITAKYEDLNDRRERLLKEFRNLKETSFEHPNVRKPEGKSHQGSEREAHFEREYQNYESPCARELLRNVESRTSNSEQQSNGCIPLSLAIGRNCQNSEFAKRPTTEFISFQEEKNENLIVLGPKKASNQEYNRLEEPNYINRNEIYMSPERRKALKQRNTNDFQQKAADPYQVRDRVRGQTILARIEENTEPGVGFSRNESSKTPSKRRQYRYYFD